jgi:hypothetical protein
MTQIKPKYRSFAYRADALNLNAASGHDRGLTDDGDSPMLPIGAKPGGDESYLALNLAIAIRTGFGKTTTSYTREVSWFP